MADEELVVASAVVVPEEAQPVSQASPPPQETNGSLKRRQSSVSSISSKRPRLSADGVGEAISPPRDAPPPNRKASLKMDSQEERNRGRRLFGNVLGALSQRSTTAAQRKRAEIEKKAQEKQRMRVEEDEAVRKERLEALNRKRRKEQVVWDERSMKIRHENIRATARFLRTDAEPRLYYKPYDLTWNEEDRIKQQVDEVEDIIDRELDEWDEKRRRERRDEDEVEPVNQSVHAEEEARQTDQVDGQSKSEEVVGDSEKKATEDGQATNENGDFVEPVVNGDTAMEDTDRSTSIDTNGAIAAPIDHENGKEAADDGGEVVEGEEDTVIY